MQKSARIDPVVVSRDGMYWHDSEYAFSATKLEDALVFTDPDMVDLWDGMPDVKLEYLVEARAREERDIYPDYYTRIV